MQCLINGKSIHYDILGKGEPVLLVHGWGGNMESMRPLATILSEKYQTIIVDLPGFGKSEMPDPTWEVEEYAHILTLLVESLKLKKITYFGHSFGGSLGIWLAAKKTPFIHALVLCDSSFKRNAKKHPFVRFLHHLLPLNNMPFRMMFYRVFFRNSDIARFPHLEKNFRLIAKHDLSELPATIQIPTLILWGRHDTITPVAWAYELHEKIKDSTLKIIDGARHGLPIRQPKVVADAITHFLDS